MASVQSTIRFIEDHGHFATATADGILAMSWVRGADDRDDDEWCEEAAIFPVIDGNVSLREVKDWLGY